jgi:hypothetical protein
MTQAEFEKELKSVNLMSTSGEARLDCLVEDLWLILRPLLDRNAGDTAEYWKGYVDAIDEWELKGKSKDLINRIQGLEVKGRVNGPGFTHVEVPVMMRDEIVERLK